MPDRRKPRAIHAQMTDERIKAANALKVSYKQIKDQPAFQDVMAKLQKLADLHTKMAKDGVGYRDRGTTNVAGQPEQELVFFTNNKRASELDRANGLEEGLAYIERQITDEALKPLQVKKRPSETEA